MHIVCGVLAVPGGVHHVFQVEYESPSIYLCVGDIRAIFNWLAAGGPDSKVALLMDNNRQFLVEFVVTIEQAY
jgi:hypothetical protein